ncbi:MAG: hypothetical protein ISS56_20420 [Anaerolineae bacterium]|nr:hypothetical protein [Anaerolineae bacterium]
MANVTIAFSLDDKRDRALLHWLESLGRGKRSQAIRRALLEHIEGSRVTIGDVYQVVTRIERSIGRGIVVHMSGEAQANDSDGDAPGTEAAAANLDSLAL